MSKVDWRAAYSAMRNDIPSEAVVLQCRASPPSDIVAQSPLPDPFHLALGPVWRGADTFSAWAKARPVTSASPPRARRAAARSTGAVAAAEMLPSRKPMDSLCGNGTHLWAGSSCQCVQRQYRATKPTGRHTNTRQECGDLGRWGGDILASGTFGGSTWCFALFWQGAGLTNVSVIRC